MKRRRRRKKGDRASCLRRAHIILSLVVLLLRLSHVCVGNYAADLDARRSVSWNSRVRSGIAASTCEAEIGKLQSKRVSTAGNGCYRMNLERYQRLVHISSGGRMLQTML